MKPIKYMQTVKNDDDRTGMGVFVQNPGRKPHVSIVFYPNENESFNDVRQRARNYYDNVSVR